MDKRKKSPARTCNIKQKMTKEQLQLAILKKKECDAKALTIVERLLEPDVDPAWLVENLKDINRCHMEDVIEERAITKLCGYILCQKPLTTVYNQRYHISLKDKKVYDITKRKNFCSAICYGASNYVLEQMLTSPLWLRDNEVIPTFRIFLNKKQESNISMDENHGEEINIAVKNSNQEMAMKNEEPQDSIIIEGDQLKKEKLQIETEKDISGCIENFVLEAVKNFELKDIDSIGDKISVSSDEQKSTSAKSATKIDDVETTKKVDGKEIQTRDKVLQKQAQSKNDDSTFTVNFDQFDSSTSDCNKQDTMLGNDLNIEVTDKSINSCEDDDIIEQCVYPIDNEISHSNSSSNVLKKHQIDSEDENIIQQSSYPVENRYNEAESTSNSGSTHKNTLSQDIERNEIPNDLTENACRKKKQRACKKLADVNLAARVEESFHEWVTNQTVDYLFGDESIKKRVINSIEIQESHRILCGKLDRLQVEEEREDAEILGKTALKPAPHFSVLKEEGEKLDLKVRAFYEGKTTFEEPPKFNTDGGTADNAETFLPLTDVHAPQLLRRKIFLEKLDQVLLDLLRTLAGNNDVYARTSLNYSSVRCTAIKALVHTFSLSAKNIIFKTAEWTLVGLVIIKMISLSDRYLASLLATKQANLYVSMILTAYKLDSDYLNLLVSSFNPNMNPR